MKTRKLLALTLAAACVTSSLAGCGEKKEAAETTKAAETVKATEAKATEAAPQASAAPEAAPFDPRSITEGVTLTVAAVGKPNIIDYETNAVTKKIEEDLGVNLEFITIPSADYHSKLNVMVAGGEALPDIVLYPWGNTVNWAEEGAIIPLNEYFDNPDYSANMRKFIQENGVDYVEDMKDSDGLVWRFPLNEGGLVNREYGAASSLMKLWIYEPWVEALGKEMPTTVEEFYELCKLVKETDLNGNGKHDEIPLTGWLVNLSESTSDAWLNFLINPYVYSSGYEMAFVEDGKVGLSYADDRFKDGLKFVKKWIDEGLIPEESITNTIEQGKALLQGEEQIVFAWPSTVVTNVKNTEWAAGYTPIVALTGENGKTVSHFKYDEFSYNGTSSSTGPVISADCENPLAAFLVLDYFCSEEISLMNEYGEEGVNWDYWENAKVENKEDYVPVTEGYDISLIQYNRYQAEPQNVGYTTYTTVLVPERILGGLAVLNAKAETPEQEWANTINKKLAAVNLEHLQYKPEEVISSMPITTEESADIADINATLAVYVPEAIGAFLTGTKDLDADWDAYIAELKNIGIDKLIDVYQAGYDRTK